jgi:DNA polymerase-3 subunit delta'
VGILIKNSNIAFLEKKFYENKLSHVFLIETDDKVLALEDIKALVKIMNCPSKYDENCSSCNICNLIKEDLLPTFKIIYPDGQAIKKSQMEELKNAFSCIPVISKYNVYVINDAEKFNASSANTMLKFIEEPEDKIIGFLITNNKENVINTIVR